MGNYDFEMPTPCQHCGEIFDLNDGFGSEKWYPNTVICEGCYRKEEAEIEEDDRWEDINNEISNALYGLDKEEGAWGKITDENRALIIQLVSNSVCEHEYVYKILHDHTAADVCTKCGNIKKQTDC